MFEWQSRRVEEEKSVEENYRNIRERPSSHKMENKSECAWKEYKKNMSKQQSSNGRQVIETRSREKEL